MNPADIFWHIYRRDRIKPPLHGRLVYLLEVPCAPGSPVARNVFDPASQDFPGSIGRKIGAALASRHHGIVYEGVSKAAAHGLLLVDPTMRADDPRFLRYNQEVVCNSRLFFLANPDQDLEALPEALGRLLRGIPLTSSDLHLQI
jgi:hypothetical protein